VEFGAGNGQFAAGLLSALSEGFEDLYRKTTYAIVDRSMDAVRRCAQSIELHRERVQFLTQDQFAGTSPSIVFSNELLDAFPVHRLKRIGSELKELYIDLVDDKFTWVTDSPSSADLVEYCEAHVCQVAEGQTIDINLRIGEWLKSIAESLNKGFVVTVDYGDEQSRLYDSSLRFDGTLRAFRQHSHVDNFLETPGDCDLTTTVDWTFAISEGKRRGLEVEKFERLDQFLLNAGLLSELETRLNATTSDAERSQLTTSAREMILPGGMASSFQILVQKGGVDD
jgi:SAM-dependent MidA family methyltransferase